MHISRVTTRRYRLLIFSKILLKDVKDIQDVFQILFKIHVQIIQLPIHKNVDL